MVEWSASTSTVSIARATSSVQRAGNVRFSLNS